jgi:hypothetical protein
MKVFVSVLLIILLILSLSLGIDENAMKLQDEAFSRALVSFGLAKGLNAIISLIQGTELSFTPVGIGLNFSVGEILDPFNDMVERFSWVMLASTVSLGIQKILLMLSSKLFLKVVIVLSISLSLIFLWTKKLYNKWFFIMPFKIVLFLLILRFGAVLSIYTTEYLYQSTLHVEYINSEKIVQKTQYELEDLHKKNTQFEKLKKEKSSWYESDILKEMGLKYEEIKKKLNIKDQLDKLSKSIDDSSKHIINLITIFVIQTILMPLLFLYLMLISMRWIFNVKVNSDKIASILNKG